FNVDSFPALCAFVQRELQPDSYITEIAEQRVELDTVGLGITPTAEKYSVAIDTLLESLREQKLTGVSQVTQAFRRQYYERVKRTAKAAALRRSIKAGECHCPLANAAYTNMLTHVPTLLKVATDVARSRRPSVRSPLARPAQRIPWPAAHADVPPLPTRPTGA